MDAEALADLAALGVTVEAPPAAAEDAFEIAPENVPALRAWLACETQWRAVLTPRGAWIWLGLDYTAVDVVLRRLSLPDATFEDLRVMERAALETFNED